ncbi:carboxymuconolactone decarboxylase family protein [Halopiger djelfimassiliensis]|uniref:carboxymuconolactone decarboxylase family protein n=1 Tax=Halopiger djelfimassiliensis TaxID=1293047 RepID=UPI000677F17F|nr:carboxymuconolactone decarboxylase family protein [Halopiger djelfimassiliensis]
MVTNQTREEIREYLGQVPDWIAVLAEPASDHSWGLVRDLELGETELSAREKALVGAGVAAAIRCPYCSHFHKEEARMEGVTEDELEEAITLASATQYFSTVLHGNEIDIDDFVAETAEIVEHIEEQEATADD